MNGYDEQHRDQILAKYAPHSASAMLQAIEPLFACNPIYVIARNRANAGSLPQRHLGAYGWTGDRLASQCEGWLRSIGQWKGDGYAMIFNRPITSLEDPQFTGTVLHEAAHWAEWGVTKTEDHGPTFVRAAAHLHHRAKPWLADRGFAVSLGAHMLTPAARYPDATATVDALADELRESHRGTPILRHLRKPLPAAFAQLFESRPASRPTPSTSAATPSRSPAAKDEITVMAGAVVTLSADGTVRTAPDLDGNGAETFPTVEAFLASRKPRRATA